MQDHSLPPLVISMPWLSCANRAECWAPPLPIWDWESPSVKRGGGPGGGGGGQEALGEVVVSHRKDGAIGPWNGREW